jgi:hypothetical protein
MTGTLRLLAAVSVLAAAAAIAATGGPVAAAPGQPAPEDDPSRQVLAVISPIAAPACNANGSATLLLPIVLGPEAGDLALDALGPMFIVCGTLPGAPGSTCQLDSGIIGLYPEQAESALSPPSPVGGIVDSVDATEDLLGLDGPAQTLHDAFACHLPEPASAPGAPPAAPVAPTTPGQGAAAAPEQQAAASDSNPVIPARPVPAGSSSAASGAPSSSAVAAPSRPIVELLDRVVPGGVVALQILLALLLAAYLGASWTASLRLARADRQ